MDKIVVEWLDKSCGRVRTIPRAMLILARELSRARILPAQDSCCRCTSYGPDTCADCWLKWAEAKAREDGND